MNVFQTHKVIVDDYLSYIKSFLYIKDERIREKVEAELQGDLLCPDPIIQFNPSYQIGGSTEKICADLNLHADLAKVFPGFQLYAHQKQALGLGAQNKNFIVTSGTGSGKSITYLGTIFNYISNQTPKQKGIKAIIVYPMNALINSQYEEIQKHKANYLKQFLTEQQKALIPSNEKDALRYLETHSPAKFPYTYEKYTGQQDLEARLKVESDPPDIILTNYMMLELMMTRNAEFELRESLKDHLQFLVFDELHTYRGRQGSDVAMLIRRISANCTNDITFIGTSATMASGGSEHEEKEVVAEFAKNIFGSTFSPDQIIGETLSPSTNSKGTLPSKEELRSTLSIEAKFSGSKEDFKSHPLAIWLETAIALVIDERKKAKRNVPLTFNQIVETLAEYTGLSQSTCEEKILNLLQWSEALNIDCIKKGIRESFLPFKIHQFISQTGNVYVSLDPKNERYITIESERYIKEDGQERYLYPVLFSRFSGYDFLCVTKDSERGLLIPRDTDEMPPRITKADLKGDKELGIPAKKLTSEDFAAGYILIPDEGDDLWTDEDIDNLPHSWFKRSKNRQVLDNYYEYRIPRRIYFNNSGEYSETPGSKYPQWGWFLAAKLILDPTSGMIFDLRTKENTKLMRLGNEGRSTATTITSFNVLKNLRDSGIPLDQRKLLSFTDNRQDASLQAGHFNDFITTGKLRSAIFHAIDQANGASLDINIISDKIFKALSLNEAEYARYPSEDPTWPDPDNEEALKDYLFVRLIYDLKRGWRYNTPNLEQCGLLQIGYTRLEEFSQRDSFFENVYLFDILSPEERAQILTNILNYFRTSYAIEHYKLSDGQRGEMENKLKNKLDVEKLWSLDYEEKIDVPYYLTIRKAGKTPKRVFTKGAGPTSNLGKYLKRVISDAGLERLSGAEYYDFIENVFGILIKGHFVSKEQIRSEHGMTDGYRLRLDKVLWKPGDKTKAFIDETRALSYKSIEIRPNEYFKRFYQQDFGEFEKPLVAREHTGQLTDYQERIKREEDFRNGNITTLYCSPTMELGVDISSLNVVHMRNVPPSPANYAQRSGRAGRSGQTALVFTYCSNGSPHDKNYFKDQRAMVAGKVMAPKIDLINEDLVKAHLHAYILMVLRLESLKNSVADILDLNLPGLPIKQDLQNYIVDQLPEVKSEIFANFNSILQTLQPDLSNSYWFSESWLTKKVDGFLDSFHSAFDRWRKLFKAAEETKIKARAILDDHTIKPDHPSRKEAYFAELFSIRQRDLLLNSGDQKGKYSEFYVFRYLASEGFLPGYNFTRLPVRVFAGSKDKGEYISRSRFMGLKEFGPQNLIYHNGGKYRIHKMNITDADSRMRRIKISKRTGYAWLDQEGKGINNDPINGASLTGEENVLIKSNLLELTDSEARPQERISCEEEERSSTGYDIQQYFSVPGGIQRLKRLYLKWENEPLLEVNYAPAARLIHVNHKWRIAKKDEYGYAIGKVSGRWKRKRELEVPNEDDPTINVEMFTHENADMLYIQPIAELGLEVEPGSNGVVTLTYALKRAIERLFQVEENEIGAWIMGKTEEPNILIYESSEGSLGILSQLIQNTILLKQVFEEAYQICQFDPETLEDSNPEEPKASYDNLLSYYNQRHHEDIDRYSVKGALEKLMNASAEVATKFDSLEAQYQYLKNSYDLNSATELPFIEYLYKNGIRLPDKAQVNAEECYANADFVYSEDNVIVMCDGSVHRTPEVQEADKRKRNCLRDAGYDVIEWFWDQQTGLSLEDSIKELVETRKDIFRKIH